MHIDSLPSPDSGRGPDPGPVGDELSVDDLLALDREHVWHPYAPMPGTVPSLPVASARGVRLRLADGTELIDGMASWWSAIHGYRHPVLDRAAHRQVDRMSHVMFGGLTHEPAVRLSALLARISPEPLRHVFLADSGSVSVEVALKMCLQYQVSRGRPERRRLLTWRGGYHGDTWHPMSVCDPDGGMHHLWSGALPRQVFVDAPPAEWDEGYARVLAEEIGRHADGVAAVVVEPVVQGAGGMRFHHPGYLRVLREACDRHGVLLVFDEIATGFGRTGELFAADHAGVAPDVMCVGKALTGGYLTLAATLCTPAVARGIAEGEVPVLAHGPTFMGNPLACAVALASVGLVLDGGWRADVSRLEEGLRAGLEPAAGRPGTRDVRVLGGIGVIEVEGGIDMATAGRIATEHGVWLRPFRNLVYAMPPYPCTADEVGTITEAMRAVAEGARS
ncbi:adenosylmethionine--8-amino-7-oxononanoate transaminase [Streptomyces alkaliphilus]|uniref:adenosylmethionine--8-amino-7-oxononanoate transaminase n=1 Tax=Streptomyces alkaliphilus TaxID=1472722 RepID=UPI00117E19B1|nr:adenosylmethionine--8-amino-7-oxononanoate transaminase [Streptomyces alkaliphilus]MQS06831.1 adenosylmethionine--8-amino-7-oxononanoate transaminase [Streptomyces alkaliphilus]